MDLFDLTNFKRLAFEARRDLTQLNRHTLRLRRALTHRKRHAVGTRRDVPVDKRQQLLGASGQAVGTQREKSIRLAQQVLHSVVDAQPVATVGLPERDLRLLRREAHLNDAEHRAVDRVRRLRVRHLQLARVLLRRGGAARRRPAAVARVRA